MKPHERLLDHWRRTGAGIATAAADEAVLLALEARYGIRLPDDFREYLAYACPIEDGSMDAGFTSWWPIARIRNIPDEYEGEIRHPQVARDAAAYLFFADDGLWAWAWAIACGEGPDRGRIVLFGGPDRFVADDFATFVDRYVAGDRSIHP